MFQPAIIGRLFCAPDDPLSMKNRSEETIIAGAILYLICLGHLLLL